VNETARRFLEREQRKASAASAGIACLGRSCCRGSIAGELLPFPAEEDFPPGPDREAVIVELRQLKAQYAPMIAAARQLVREDGSVHREDLEALPQWPAFVEDLRGMYRRHRAYLDTMGRKPATSGAAVATGLGVGVALVGGVALLLGRRS
jgi:hypothetical protein